MNDSGLLGLDGHVRVWRLSSTFAQADVPEESESAHESDLGHSCVRKNGEMSRLAAVQSSGSQRVSTGRNAIVTWAKNATQGYEGVAIRNLNKSWANGLGAEILQPWVFGAGLCFVNCVVSIRSSPPFPLLDAHADVLGSFLFFSIIKSCLQAKLALVDVFFTFVRCRLLCLA